MKELEVVAGIIIKDKQILCMQRNQSKYEYVSYKFEFPGGKIEPGETFREALKRELIEELDMVVEIDGNMPYISVTHEYPDFKILMHAFICHINSDIFVMHEHVDFKWLGKDELLTLDWAPADMPIVHKLMIE